ncbi:MAG: hypothetical protein ACKOOG_00270 [Actinomycetota bacterium]
MIPTERIERLLDPAYSVGLADASDEVLRAKKVECAEAENAVSFLRRLAQARLEILGAERERRANGGTVGDLVRDLPRILGGDAGRSAAANTRVASTAAPALELHWTDGRESLVDDATLANLPVLTDAGLDEAYARLGEFERELSTMRRGLHGVIDGIEAQLLARQVPGA